MSIPNGQSFNDSELSRGLHLLTESSHNVKVNIPSVPPEKAHLYPRLVGSNWTCCLSQPCVVLGRTSTVISASQKRCRNNVVDVDLGDSKAISRRHCEIRFSSRRDRWELYVYGRNGVKIDHAVRKPKDKPTVLRPTTLIEIDKTRFVFILPNHYIKPVQNSSEEGVLDFDAGTPNNNEESSINVELENAIIKLFETRLALSTKELVDKLKETYDKPVDKENVLHLLVLSQKFELAPSSVTLSFSESDAVSWIYIPSKDSVEESSQDPSQDRTLGSQSSTHNPPLLPRPSMLLEREKSIISKSTMTPPPISLSKLFIDDADWPIDADISEPFDDADGSLNHDNDLSIPAYPGILSPEITSVTTAPLKPPPILFRGLSIESMYSVWTQAQSNANNEEPSDDEERPKKRTKTIQVDSVKSTREPFKDRNIYKEVRTDVLFSSS